MSKENSDEVAQEGGGDGPKKDIYENRGSKKLIRLVTVMAYMFSVSFVAIVLSAYYLFLWEPPNPRLLRKPVPMSSEPEVQFLISEEMTLRNESKMDFVPRVSSRQNLIDGADRERMHRRKMNESLFLLRNSLVEFLYDRINDSRPTGGKRTANSAPGKEKSFNSTGKLSGRGTRHSSEIMSRVFNDGASLTLDSPTISGGEANNDRFTSTRSTYAYEPPRNIPPSDLTIASNDPPSIDSSRDTPRFIDRLKNAPRSSETPAQLANAALNLKDREERMQLPRKMSAQNVMASISRTLGNREHKPTGNEIRFAGDERKDKLYEPKHKQKLVRVLTVVAYVIFVSMAAILLSLYYTFLWDPKDVSIKMRVKPECANVKLPNSLTTPSILNEAQTERTTTSPAIGSEDPLPELATAQPQKDFLTILTEIVNATSSSLPSSTPEDLQTDSSVEIKETSTKMHSMIT